MYVWTGRGFPGMVSSSTGVLDGPALWPAAHTVKLPSGPSAVAACQPHVVCAKAPANGFQMGSVKARKFKAESEGREGGRDLLWQ